MNLTSKHTPGPWTATVDKPNAKLRMSLVQPGDNRAIDCTGSGATYAEEKANAYLIAAAPDMLEALEIALAALSHEALSNVERARYIGEIRAAIAKAEGRS